MTIPNCAPDAVSDAALPTPLKVEGPQLTADQRQTARLKQLPEYCRSALRRFMFELPVPATSAQMDHVHGDRFTHDLRSRPEVVSRIAGRHREWAAIFSRGQTP